MPRTRKSPSSVDSVSATSWTTDRYCPAAVGVKLMDGPARARIGWVGDSCVYFDGKMVTAGHTLNRADEMARINSLGPAPGASHRAVANVQEKRLNFQNLRTGELERHPTGQLASIEPTRVVGHRELARVLGGRVYELVLVDDGSTDGTAAEIARIRSSAVLPLHRPPKYFMSLKSFDGFPPPD